MVIYLLDDQRLRQANRYALQNGYAAGIHNFEDLFLRDVTPPDGGFPIAYGVNLFKHGPYIEWKDVFKRDLPGAPAISDVQATWCAIHEYAQESGYFTGFPTFEEADYGRGVVYGAMLLKAGSYIEWKDVFKRDLPGAPAISDVQATWRAIHEYAQESGYFTGFPTFEEADYGRGVVYGAMLLKDFIEFQYVPEWDLPIA